MKGLRLKEVATTLDIEFAGLKSLVRYFFVKDEEFFIKHHRIYLTKQGRKKMTKALNILTRI
jgi:hypothetical protein